MPSPNIACGEVVERALEVGHGQALVDGEALDLVEDRGVGGVQLVGAEHPAGADDVDRRLARRAVARICTGEVWVRSTTPDSSPSGLDEERVLHLRGPGGRAGCSARRS